MKGVGKRLEEILDQKGLSQIDLSKLINVPQTTISGWVNHDYITLKNIQKVCEKLNMSLWEYFVDRSEIEKFYNIGHRYIEFAKKMERLPDPIQEKFLDGCVSHLESVLMSLEK